MPLVRMPRITPAAAVMPGGVRQRAAGSNQRLLRFESQAAGGASDYDSGQDGGAGAVLTFKRWADRGDVYLIQVGQGGEAGSAVASAGQGGGSTRVWLGTSTADIAALLGIAGAGGGAGDAGGVGGAGGQDGAAGTGDEAGGGATQSAGGTAGGSAAAGASLEGGDGYGGSGTGGGQAKGWPDGGTKGLTGGGSSGGGGGGGRYGGGGGGRQTNGSGAGGGSSWADPTRAFEITYLDGSGATPNAGRNALFSGYGAGGTNAGDDGQDGRVLVYDDETDELLATFDATGASQYFVTP